MAVITATELAEAIAVNQQLADRLHPVCVAMVNQYAPAAPDEIRSEGIIRLAGWLNDQPAAAFRENSVNVNNTIIETKTYMATRGAMLQSGAAGLLSPFKVRRAGVIAGRST